MLVRNLGTGIALVVLASAGGCTKQPTQGDQSFTAYQTQELQAERNEFIVERTAQLEQVENEIQRTQARIQGESQYVDTRQKAEWDQRLWELKQEKDRLSAELERARNASLPEWQQMRGRFSTSVDMLQANVSKVGDEIASFFQGGDEPEGAAMATREQPRDEVTATNLCIFSVPGATALVESSREAIEVTVVTADDQARQNLRQGAEEFTKVTEYRGYETDTQESWVEVPVRTSYETISNGVKVTMSPTDQDQLLNLHAAVSKAAAAIGDNRGCPAEWRPVISQVR